MSGYLNSASLVKSERSILDYFFLLEKKGLLRFEGKKGKEYFFGYEFQKTGSISVKEAGNLWYDHSQGIGGDIIQAVQVFEKKSFKEALQLLSRETPDLHTIRTILKPEVENKQVKLQITSIVNIIQHPALVQYLHFRGLKVNDITDIGCEVHWRRGSSHSFGIGFKNSSLGYAVRSKYFKGNINGGGISEFTIGERPNLINVFEGNIDLVSFKKLNPGQMFTGIALNSTANLGEILCQRLSRLSIENGMKVCFYLDKGKGGRDATEKGLKLIQGSVDRSSFYIDADFNDVNDFLTKRKND